MKCWFKIDNDKKWYNGAIYTFYGVKIIELCLNDRKQNILGFTSYSIEIKNYEITFCENDIIQIFGLVNHAARTSTSPKLYRAIHLDVRFSDPKKKGKIK